MATPNQAQAEPPTTSRRRRGHYQEKVQQLEQQHQLLLSQIAQEQQARSQLELENSVVTSLCESLTQAHVASTGQLQQQDNNDHKQQQRLVDLLAAEGLLLQQLGSVPATSGCRQQELLQAASVDGDQHPTIAPANDPMALYTEFLARGRLPNLDSLTSMDLTQTYKVVVQDLAVHLQFLDAGMTEPATAVARIQQSFESLMHMLLWCMLAGKSQLVYEYQARDADTMQLRDAAALAGRSTQIAQAISSLNLTQHQQEALASHWRIWTRILAPADSELAALQKQLSTDKPSTAPGASDSSTTKDMHAPAGSAPDATTTPCSSGSSGSRSRGGNGGDGNVSIVHWSVGIEAEMQQVDRLQVVMQKQRLLMAACSCWLLGRFSWPQLARFVVLTWPHPVPLTTVCQCVHDSWAVQQRHGSGSEHNSSTHRVMSISGTPKR